MVGTIKQELHGLFRSAEFLFHIGGKHVPVYAHAFLATRRYSAQTPCLAGNCIGQTTRLDIGKSQVILLLTHINEAGKQFVGVGALLVNVVTAVSAAQTLHLQFKEEHASGGVLKRVRHLRIRAATACTAHKDFALVLAVKIHQHASLHEARLHTFCTGQTSFLVACENTFNGTMLDVRTAQDSHLHGHADTVIRAQRCTLCLHPFAVHISLDGILVKVELHIGVLLAHHVHVALQDEGLAVLHSRSGGLADNHVSGFVTFSLQTQAFSIFGQEVNHLLLSF